VIKIVTDDSNNALVNYAVKKSDAVKARVDAASTEAEKSAILEKARQDAVYRLSDTIITNSKSKESRAVTCSGTMYTTVEGTYDSAKAGGFQSRTGTGWEALCFGQSVSIRTLRGLIRATGKKASSTLQP
jgi:hypothetical protein